MTDKKPLKDHIKSGPKPNAKKVAIEKKLKELYYQDGITNRKAGEIAGCSAEEAGKQFKIIGAEVADHQVKDEDWITKNDRVRERSLEGLSEQIYHCDLVLKRLNDDRKKVKQMHENILPDLTQKVQDTELGEMLEKCDAKTVLYLQKVLNRDLDLYKNYGYYLLTFDEKIQTREVLKAELQQQYDTIETLPPPSEVLDRVVERKIAQKLKLAPALPELAKVTMTSPKKKKRKAKK